MAHVLSSRRNGAIRETPNKHGERQDEDFYGSHARPLCTGRRRKRNTGPRTGPARVYELYADLRERLGREVPINILTVREATTEEIELMKWHNEMVAKHHQQ